MESIESSRGGIQLSTLTIAAALLVLLVSLIASSVRSVLGTFADSLDSEALQAVRLPL